MTQGDKGAKAVGEEAPAQSKGRAEARTGGPLSAAAAAERRRKRQKVARRVTGQTRLIATIPAVGFFLAALVLAVGTLVRVVEIAVEFVELKIDVMQLGIELVEYADLFLLAVVLYILALGLITLFVTDDIPLPSWLTFNDFDDLKERLVSVISVMLGVYFLGCVLNGASGLDILWLGLGCAAVIAALTMFVKLVIRGHGAEGGREGQDGEEGA